MAFNITAQLQMRGPANLRAVINQIQGQFRNLKATVDIKINQNAVGNIGTLNSSLGVLNANLANLKSNLQGTTQALSSFSRSMRSATNQTQGNSNTLNNTGNNLKTLQNSAQQTGKSFESMGKHAAAAVKRFGAFSAVTVVMFNVLSSVKSAIDEAIQFQDQLVKISQVTGVPISGLKGISDEVTRLSTTFGVSSKKLLTVSQTLAQAGFSAKDVKIALESLARTELAPTFGNIEQTVEGAIAAMAQFDIEAKDLGETLSVINSVSAKFAVESDDIITAVRRTGAAFKASGGSLNEMIALFTSVRATTRESAETIATGFRTIFTRIQRPKTLEFLKTMGINLQDAKGNFVGAYEAVRLLNSALAELETTDPRFSQIIEELGGYRQITKVIPLVQEFATAQKALNVANRSGQSLIDDSVTAQQSLLVQITKVKEEFFELFRVIGDSAPFQSLIKGSLGLASSLIGLAKSFAPILPILGGLAAFKIGSGAFSFGKGFVGAFTGNGALAQGGQATHAVTTTANTTAQNSASAASTANTLAVNNLGTQLQNLTVVMQALITRLGTSLPVAQPVLKKFARGGLVPGVGNTDSVPAMLQPGEFVIRKAAVDAIGANRLFGANKFGRGGGVEGLSALDFKGLSGPRNPNIKQILVDELAISNQDEQVFGISDKVLNTITNRIGVSGFSSNFFNAYRTKKTVDKSKPQISKKQSEALARLNLPSRVGAIVLDPVDTNRPASFNITNKDLGIRGDNSRDIDLSIHGLSHSISDGFKSETTNKLIKLVDDQVAFLGKQLNVNDPLTKKRDAKDFIDKVNLNAMIGSVFEGAIAGLGAPYDKNKDTDPFDFIDGLGPDLAKAFNASDLAGIPVDAKKSAGSDLISKIRKKYIRQYARKSKKFAIGGSAGTDTVPAMLTPGEFVLRKEAAQKIGRAGLDKLNHAEKFAHGGPVGFAAGGPAKGFSPEKLGGLLLVVPQIIGSLANLNEGFGKLATTLVSSLGALSLFSGTFRKEAVTLKQARDQVREKVGLSAATEAHKRARDEVKTLQKQQQDAASAGNRQLALSFDPAINSAVRKRDAARQARQEKIQTVKSEAPGLVTKGGIDKTQAGVAVVATGLSLIGNFVQESALQQIKQGGNNSGKAAVGGALAQAGQFGALGATAGAAFGPVGIAVGGGLGALVGAVTGAVTAFEEAEKAIRALKFDKAFTEVETSFKLLSKKMSTLEIQAPRIGSNIDKIFSGINTTTGEERQGLLAQAQNQVPQLEELLSKLSESSKNIDEFNSKFNGLGANLVNRLSFLTNLPADKIRESIEKEIKARENGRKILDKLNSSQAGINSLAISLSVLGEHFNRLGESLQRVNDSVSVAAGGELPQFRGFTDLANLRTAKPGFSGNSLSDTFGSVGSELTQSFDSFSRIANVLPGVVANIAGKSALDKDGANIGGDFRDALAQALEGDNAGAFANDLVFQQITHKVEEMLNKGENGGTEFRKAIENGASEFINELLDSTKVQPLANELNKHLTDIINTIFGAGSLKTRNNLQINQNDAAVQDLRLAKGQAQAGFDNRQFTIDEFEQIFGKPQDPKNIQTRIDSVNTERQAILDNRNSLDAKIKAEENPNKKNHLLEEANAAASRLSVLDTEADKLKRTFEKLKNPTERLSVLQAQLANEQNQRRTTRSLKDTALFGTAEEKIKLGRTARLATTAIQSGIKNVPHEERKDVFDLIKQLADSGNENVKKILDRFRQELGGDADKPGKGEEALQEKIKQTYDKAINAQNENTIALKANNLLLTAKKNENVNNIDKQVRESLTAGLKVQLGDRKAQQAVKGGLRGEFSDLVEQFGFTEDKAGFEKAKNFANQADNIAALRAKDRAPSVFLADVKNAGIGRIDSAAARNKKLLSLLGVSSPDIGIGFNHRDTFISNSGELQTKLVEAMKESLSESEVRKIFQETEGGSGVLFNTGVFFKNLIDNLSKAENQKRAEENEKKQKVKAELTGEFGAGGVATLQNISNENLKGLLAFSKQIKDLNFDELDQAVQNLAKTIEELEKQIAANNNLNKATGGLVYYASGGRLRPKNGDRIPGISSSGTPVGLQTGEYVVNARSTAKHMPLLDAINNDSTGSVFMANGGTLDGNKVQRRIRKELDPDNSSTQGIRELVRRDILGRVGIDGKQFDTRDLYRLRKAGFSLEEIAYFRKIELVNYKKGVIRNKLISQAKERQKQREVIKDTEDTEPIQEPKQKLSQLERERQIKERVEANLALGVNNIPHTASSAAVRQHRLKVEQNANDFIETHYKATGGTIDSVPALLTPGEYVLPPGVARRIGSENLKRVGATKFAEGGPVSGGFNKNFNTVNAPSRDNSQMMTNINQFVESSKSLVDSLNKIPSTISIEGSIKPIEVIINGADVLSQLQGPLQELITSKINESINSVVQKNFPKLGFAKGTG